MSKVDKTCTRVRKSIAWDVIHAVRKDPNVLQGSLADVHFGVEAHGRSFALTTTDGEVLPVTVRVLGNETNFVHGAFKRYVDEADDGSLVVRHGVAFLTLQRDQAQLVIVSKALLGEMLTHPETKPLVRRSRGLGRNLTLWRWKLNDTTPPLPGMTLHSFPADQLLAP